MNYFILAKIGNVNMKKTFQKTLIAAAAGVALMSAAGTASANSLLFPYFTTATGAQSVLSLVNAGSASAVENIHYVYNYGAACTHFDATGKLTANDILSHSIAATTAGGFGKVVGTDTSTPVYFPLANQTGFLVVSNTSTGATDALSGSMAIVDPASGLVMSYAGINNGLNTLAAGGEGNFAATVTDSVFELTSLPSAVTSTSWYGVVAGNMNSVITAGADWKGVATFTNNGVVFNNDEVQFSGTSTKAITCAGSIASTDLMSAATAAAVGTNGSLIKATASFTVGGTGVVLTKFQTVQAAVGAPFAGKQFAHRETAY
jgi:hypothetical protein